ncbi:SAR2788 family putative toxin [Glutamicibacter sp. NPDC127525]|uniref:SAR2788 family putative toxin n=1 Tax=unclassified Glutamicibacter TaxID=2627139 RepID=UPI00362E2068
MPVQLKRIFSGIGAVTALAVVLTGANLSPADASVMPNSVHEFSHGDNPPELRNSAVIIDDTNELPIESILGDQIDNSSEDYGVHKLADIYSTELISKTSEDGETLVVELDGTSVESTIEVSYPENAPLEKLVDSITVDAVVDGEDITADLIVENFIYLGGEEFSATVRDRATGDIMEISSTQVTAQAFPALYILGVLARVGIKALIKHFGKTQVKKAAKSYLLNGKGVNWSKIMAPKHRWSSVGAKSKQQIADLMARAFANGTHRSAGKGMIVEWKYKGETIVVTYGKSTGKIGDGWVKKR